MANLKLASRAKCSGCKALLLISDGRKFDCKLGFSIRFQTNTKGKAFGPVPSESCYKPKLMSQLHEAEKLKVT